MTIQPLLLIEDSPTDAVWLEQQLREDPLLRAAEVEHVETLGDALDHLREGTYGAVLVDLGLPDSEGLATFDAVNANAGAAAVVVISGQDDAQLAEDAVRNGAQDYLVKSVTRPAEVGRAIAYAIRRQRVLSELGRARDEQLAAKDRFLSHVSHELRSPLSVVHQFASLLLDEVAGPLSPDQNEFLTILMRNVSQLRVMIDDLLEVSRVQRGRLAVTAQLVSLEPLVTETAAAYRPVAEQCGVTLSVVLPSLPDVVADPDRVREVLANVLDNAFKFTDRGGKVTIVASTDDEFVRIRVSDTGRGIRPEDLDRIFEQFFQGEPSDRASRNGLGLGLYVSKTLIERQGGVIWAENDFGRGTSISFTLPRTHVYQGGDPA